MNLESEVQGLGRERMAFQGGMRLVLGLYQHGPSFVDGGEQKAAR